MIQTQACQIPKPVSLIRFEIDGFPLRIGASACPLGKESPRFWGIWTPKNTCGESPERKERRLRTKHGSP